MQNDDLALKTLTKQFLCQAPVREISWNFSDFSLGLQERIIGNTVAAEPVLKHPVAVSYQKAFLKQFLQKLERQGAVVCDSVYEEYARLVALPEDGPSFKHYSFEGGSIVLKENPSLISEGTTGLRTWQAALALSEWLLANTAVVTNKRVLELGSGIGLTGLVLALHCDPQTVFLTDCHPSVLTTLCGNVRLNLKTCNYKDHKQCLLESEGVSVWNLPWEDVGPELCQKLGQIDVIVAADVVYDSSLFGALIGAVDCLFQRCGAETFILCCTERNEETLKEFLEALSEYKVAELKVPPQGHFLWPSEPCVRIFQVCIPKSRDRSGVILPANDRAAASLQIRRETAAC